MTVLSSFALAAVLGLSLSAAASAQTQSVTINTDARPSTAPVQSGRSVTVQRAKTTHNGDHAEDAAGAFAFGAL